MTEVQRDRDERGWFLPGHKLAHGTDTVARLRYGFARMFAEAVKPEDILKAYATLVDAMDDGDIKTRIAAASMFLDRTLGKAQTNVNLDISATAAPQINLAALTNEELAEYQRLGRRIVQSSAVAPQPAANDQTALPAPNIEPKGT